MSPSSRRIAPALAAASLALLLAACAGSGGASSAGSPLPTPLVTGSSTPEPTTSPTISAAPSAAPAPSEAPAPASVPTSSGAPAATSSAARCVGSDLAMEYRPDPDASGAGNGAFDLVLTNTSGTACTLAGIPGVYATDAAGNRISAVADASGPNPEGLLEVRPGAQADVRIAWHSPGAYGCSVVTSAYLVAEVLDAGDGAVRAPAAVEVCTDGTVMMDASAYTLL
jgi:hypothetical protein